MRNDIGAALHGRLARRLLIWFLVFSLVPLLVTNAVGYQRSERIIRGLVQDYLATIARLQADQIRSRIDRDFSLLDAITAGNSFLAAGARQFAGEDAGAMGRVATPAAMTHYLDQKLAELKVFNALFVYLRDGRPAAAAGQHVHIPLGVPLGERMVSWVPSHSGAPAAAPELQLGIAIRDDQGVAVARLGATVSLAASKDLLQVPTFLQGGLASFVLDPSGWPLFSVLPGTSPDYSTRMRSPLVGLPPGSHLQYRSPGGPEVIGTIVAIPDYRLRLLLEVPADAALGELRKLRRLSLALELGFLALLVLATSLVAHTIVAPVNRLVSATSQVGQGDLGVRIEAGGNDEIGELGKAFNEMTGALAESNQRVRELHQREIARASQLATVGELASGVAHEIRNPVVGIMSGLDLVRRRSGHDPELEPIMGEMARQLSRIQQTIQDLLRFARPRAPTLSVVSGNHVIERAVRLVQPSAARERVRLESRLDPVMPRIHADEELLQQALVNLLMNALAATAAGGSVTITSRAEGDWFVVEIADTGHGIEPRDLEQIFKPFFTTRSTGTGLGLPITRDIIELHGGSLTLVSRAGEGTTVALRLPGQPRTPERAAVP